MSGMISGLMKASSGAGSGGGGGGGAASIDFDAMGYAERANQLLDETLRAAIPYYGIFNDRAMDEQRKQTEIARQDLQKYFEMASAYTAPYREAGYAAQDMYMDTLGIPRSALGSSAMAKAAENKAKMDAARRAQMSAATQLAGQMNLSPQQQYMLTQSLGNATNQAGALSALEELQMRTPNLYRQSPYAQIAAGPNMAGQGGQLDGSSVPSIAGRPNPYQNILDQAIASGPNPLSTWMSAALPAMNDYRVARNNIPQAANSLLSLMASGNYPAPVTVDV